MPNFSLVASKITVTEAERTVLDGVDLALSDGERIGIVGPNGAGKSTLLDVLAGTRIPDSGHVSRSPADARLSLVKQELVVPAPIAVLPYIAQVSGVAAAELELEAASTAIAEAYTEQTGQRYSDALETWERVGAADFHARAETVLADVGIIDLRRNDVSRLSGGQRARVQLAITLLSQASILLLDEPTNDLDIAGLELLEEKCLAENLGVVVVSHDRSFLERVATAILELDEYTRRGVLYSVPWKEYQIESATVRARADAAYRKFEEQQARLKERIRREQEWAAKGQRSAGAANARDGDKLSRKKAASGAQGRAGNARKEVDRLNRTSGVTKPREYWNLLLDFPEAERGGDVVARLESVTWARGIASLGPIEMQINAGDRIQLLGQNGAGKSTLLQILLGDIVPDSGRVVIGPSVRVGFLDQSRMLGHPPNSSALSAVMAIASCSAEVARSSLAKLGLDSYDVDRSLNNLSPGERTRVALAAFRLREVNFLVLDEPTNHLDMMAIEQVEAALKQFRGTVLVVSHDRTFLKNNEFTRTWEIDSNGCLVEVR